MIEEYKVEAALKSLKSHDIFHIEMVGIPREMMRRALEAAENAKPPEGAVVTEEMIEAGCRAAWESPWKAMMHRDTATATYTAMHALAPKPAPPTVTDEAVEAYRLAAAQYVIANDIPSMGEHPQIKDICRWGLTAALKVMFPDTRPKAREPMYQRFSPKIDTGSHWSEDTRSGKDRRVEKFTNTGFARRLNPDRRRTSEGR